METRLSGRRRMVARAGKSKCDRLMRDNGRARRSVARPREATEAARNCSRPSRSRLGRARHACGLSALAGAHEPRYEAPARLTAGPPPQSRATQRGAQTRLRRRSLVAGKTFRQLCRRTVPQASGGLIDKPDAEVPSFWKRALCDASQSERLKHERSRESVGLRQARFGNCESVGKFEVRRGSGDQENSRARGAR